MDILLKAIHAVDRNRSGLTLYLLITVGTGLVYTQAISLILGEGEDIDGFGPFVILLNLFYAAAYAAAQSVAFARIGREMDRPLWKIESDGEALRRFFLPWFTLNIICQVALLFRETPLAIFTILICVFYLPVGACMMFAKQTDWRKLGDTLTPLTRMFPETLVVSMFFGMVFFGYLTGREHVSEQPWLHCLLDVVCCYFECVVFAAVWLICMEHRNAPPEEDDLDGF